MKRFLPFVGLAVVATLAAILVAALGGRSSPAALPAAHPALDDYELISTGTTPPTEAQCFTARRPRRCFTPQGIQAAYNVGPLYARGYDGRGMTIAIVDSWGSDTMAHDLHVFDQAFGLPPMCGEEGVTCKPGMPTFTVFHPQGSPETKASPGNSPHQEDKTVWALEVALDVETSHAIAPGANILLVATTGAETLGVQGFPNMMKAEQDVVDNHLANVISQSFGSAEGAFGSTASLENLRDAFKAAAANGVTVLASSGDGGTANIQKQPVGQGGSLLPGQTVIWPSSDPLVTSVGGTNLCTSPFATSGRVVDSVDPPAACQANPGQAEVAWVGSGGGFSQVFDRPSYQNGVAGIGASRGVPDVAFQAAPRTGALVYISLPPDGLGSNVRDTGWYDIGGTSLSAPQWAGLIAIADQINGGGLGLINPALYKIGSDPARYASDFFDVTIGNNQTDPTIPGFSAGPGWDAVTGWGTPNAANLLPDLVAAVHGH